MKKQREITSNQYKNLLLEPKTNSMPYDDPTKFGEALAHRHAQIINEALSKWSKNLTKQTKPKSSRKTKTKQPTDAPRPS